MFKGLKFTVDGKDYTGNIKGGVEAMAQRAIVKQIENRLGSLINDVKREGGAINFDLQTNRLSINNCSQELIDKIKATF
ncbi:hypothetical protein INP83_19340 [Mucilaginibacter sp. 21P]|uniref:hypothetical protein n=1 Tax=Mucilaginibacter sp. 21P TaxID=2778902 RepID=UPI001C57F5FB|nr:hypothetical protein [Mucilaginibacter sp. 21P]QXV65207.1 hypothetical protein INP83_19340 [Mucilaginibacter sp. 21P]